MTSVRLDALFARRKALASLDEPSIRGVLDRREAKVVTAILLVCAALILALSFYPDARTDQQRVEQCDSGSPASALCF